MRPTTPATGTRAKADTSHLLIQERKTMALLPSLANLVGVHKALLLQQIHFLSEGPYGQTIHGRRYVFMTWQRWRSLERDGGGVSWLSVSTLRNHFYQLEDEGLIAAAEYTGSQGEPGWAVNHDGLTDLYERNPMAGVEPDQQANSGGVPESGTPAKRKHRGARALGSPPCQDPAAPPAESARAVYRSEERVKKSEDREEQFREAAAAQTRAPEQAATERSAPESAAAALPAAGELKDQASKLRALVERGKDSQLETDRVIAEARAARHKAAAVMLVTSGLGFTEQDAADLAARHDPHIDALAWLIRRAKERAGKGKATNPRGLIEEGLSKGWRPPPRSSQRSPASEAAERQVQVTANLIGSSRAEAAKIEADRRALDDMLSVLSIDQYQAIADQVLPTLPAPIQQLAAKQSRCWSLKYAVGDYLRKHPECLKSLHPPPAEATTPTPSLCLVRKERA